MTKIALGILPYKGIRKKEYGTFNKIRSDSEEVQEISRTNYHFPGHSRTFQDKC